MTKISQEEYIKRCREAWGDTYDLSRVVYSGGKEHIEVICRKKDELGREHGSFYPLAGNFSRGNGCPKCANRFLDTELFIAKANVIHNEKYSYDGVEYKSSQEKVRITCPIHGKFNMSPNNHLKGEGCPKCSGKYRYRTDEIVDILKSIHGDKYDYIKVDYKSMYSPITIICHKHGDFSINPVSAIHKKAGCIQCGYENMKDKQRVPVDKLIEEFKAVHGDKYDYSKVPETYVNAKTPVKIYCKKHKYYFLQTPDAHKNGVGCPKCNESKLEADIRLLLEENGIKYEYQKTINSREMALKIDYFLPKYNIAIECQGEQHFSPIDFAGRGGDWASLLLKNTIRRDKNKRYYCINNNIDILYYTSNELFDKYCKEGYLGKVFTDKEELLAYIDSKD